MITAKTKLLAVIGNPIGHSMSPTIHNAAIAERQVDFVYTAFRIEKAEEAVDAMRALGIRGFSVTIPHKETVIPFMDHLDISAERTGSVNTIINNDRVLTGYSTDGAGAVQALKSEEVDLKNKRVLIVGTGGAARAIAFALIDAGVQSIAFRYEIEEQVQRLSGDMEKVHSGIISHNTDTSEIDLLVNACPIGMSPHEDSMAVTPEELHNGLAVFDIVYNPLRTKLLREAAAAGCRTVEGVAMFAEQAILQFEMFTGASAPRELMHRVVREALQK